jgi:rare lipoprotein A
VNYRGFKPAALLLSLLLLAACGGSVRESTDGKPLHQLSAADVADAVPQAEPIFAAGNTSPYKVNGVEYRVLQSGHGYRERGIASWYGQKFHGRNTANGEVFDAYAASAAHRTLPLPSYARVTNLSNHRSIIVKVNDRGPFHADRLIDLSYGAAVSLGFSEQGTARVEVVALSVEGAEDLRSDPSLAHWKSDYRYLQVGSFSQRDAAHGLQQRLSGFTDEDVSVREVQHRGNAFYRVRIGPIVDRNRLLALREELIELGYSGVKPVPE